MTEDKKQTRLINDIVPHKVNRSVTLKREILHKPSSHSLNKPYDQNHHSVQVNKLHSQLQRSQSIPKSPYIERFQKITSLSTNSKDLESKSRSQINNNSQGYKFFDNQSNNHQSQSNQKILEQAYLKAFEQNKNNNLSSPKKNKFNLKFQLGLVAVVALVGLIGYLGLKQSQKNFLLKEDQRIGFQAQLPSYILPGFNISQKKFSNNNFTAIFKSNISSSNYVINESKLSPTNQQSIIKKYVLLNYGVYQKIIFNHITVYLSPQDNATWYKNGIWYKLTNYHQNLSIQQIISIAESI
jgi:hypothetical protein